MELVDNTMQLIALVGGDEDGNQTVIALCTNEESAINQTSRVIFESWPRTETVSTYNIELSAKARNRFGRERIAQ